MKYWVFCGLATALCFIFTIFALFNLVADFGVLGSFGSKFLYEMDEVMGRSLMGVPHYSKVEGTILLVGSLGLFTCWWGHNQTTFLGCCVCCCYMMTCSTYAYIMKFPTFVFLTMAGICFILGAITFVHLTNNEEKENAFKVLAGGMGFTILSSLIMVFRSKGQEAFHARFREINSYCDKNPHFVWKLGESAPEGFTEFKVD